MLRDLRFAIGFLTRIPMGAVDGDRSDGLDPVARSVPWFPVVGLVVGATQGATIWLLAERAGPVVAATVGVIVALLITGAFHHDGLADIADAFGGGWTIEQRFEILKDSRLGTYGTAALCSAIVLEVALFARIVGPQGGQDVPAVIAIAAASHALSRAIAVAVMTVAPVAGDGLGAGYARSVGRGRAAIAVLIGVVAGAGLLGFDVIMPMVFGGAGAGAVVALATRKIGGVTGDVLGAVQVISHLGLLLGLTLI